MQKKIRDAVEKKQNDLKGTIQFNNGLKKINPMSNIENFNKYYEKKYGFSII